MVCHPLGGAVRTDHAQYPAFAPGTSEVAVGLWPFCILFIIARTARARSCFQSLIVSLYSVA